MTPHAPEPAEAADREFARLAVELGLLTPAQLERARRAEGGPALPLAQRCARAGVLDPAQLAALFARRGAPGASGPPPATAPAADLPATLGRYPIRGLLGRGGMGVVYEAFDPRLGRTVALKVLSEGIASPRQARRLTREAQLLARLRHPNLITVHDVDEVVGPDGERRHFIAMERIEGGDLAQALQRGLARDEALTLLAAVADGAGHAHAAGIVHRDLKPQNVLLDRGRPVLTDFGLAHCDVASERLTQTGELLGTAHYMAPEQVRGARDEIAPATDVWALGVMLHQVLCGQLPFGGDSLADLFIEILDTDVPALPAGADIPPALDAVRRQALEKLPQRRYADGAALAADLRRALAGEAVQARDTQRPLRRALRRLARNRWRTVAVIALGGSVALGVPLARRLRGRRAEQQRDRRRQRWVRERDAAAARERETADGAARLRTLTDRLAPLAARTREVRSLLYVATVDPAPQLAELQRALEALAPSTEVEPLASHADVWTTLGSGWDLLGAQRRAVLALERAHRLRPDDPYIAYRLGKLLIRRGWRGVRPDRLHGRLETQLADTLERAEQLLQRSRTGWSGATQVDLDLLEVYRAVAHRDTRRALALCRRGADRHARALGREEFLIFAGLLAPSAEQRLALLSRALGQQPHSAWVRYLRALEEQRRGRPDAALQEVERCLRLAPLDDSGLSLRAQLRHAQGDHGRALADLDRAIALAPDEAMWWGNRAVVKLTTRDLHGAVADARAALERDPSLASGHRSLGRAAQLRGDHAAAVGHFRRALELAPRARTARARAASHRALGQLPAALQDLALALRIDPRDVRARVQRGQLLLQRRAFAEAEREFDRALEVDEADQPALWGRSTARIRLERLADATADCVQLTRLAPQAWQGWDRLIRLLLTRDQRRAAGAALAQALRAVPREDHGRLDSVRALLATPR